MGADGATTPMTLRTLMFFFTERRNILEEPDAYKLSSVEESKTTVILLNDGWSASISNIHQNKEMPHSRGKQIL